MDQSGTSVSYDTQTELEGSLQHLKLQDCSYFLRTGTCAFGSKCRYNHPTAEKLQVILSSNNVEDLPERPGQAECQGRPITLMPLVYKILARMMSARLRHFLPDLIHSSQTGFVQDRSILDNVVTFNEAVEWARQTEQSTAISLLDFVKAYDRVDWGHIV
ncbi:hypothetical protein L7F22_068689 [Adiantum nelumboides]|nr:hypothetical protein [Adiantum nelumboides]